MQHPVLTKDIESERQLAPMLRSEALEQAWFQAEDRQPNRRSPSSPPPPVEALGEFLGDPLADRWLR